MLGLVVAQEAQEPRPLKGSSKWNFQHEAIAMMGEFGKFGMT